MIANQLTQHAINCAKNGNHAAARQAFSEVVRLRPEDSGGWLNLGVCCLTIGDQETAQQAFERSIQLNPGNVSAYSNLAAIWVSRDQVDRALEVLDKGVQQTETHPLLLATQGALLGQIGELTAACALLSQAYALAPTQVDIALILAELLVQQQRFAEALGILDGAIEPPAPFAGRYYLAKGRALYGGGDVVAAKVAFTQAQNAGATEAAALLTHLNRGWGQPIVSKRLLLTPVTPEHAHDIFALGDNKQAWTFYNPQGITAANITLLKRDIARRYASPHLPPSELAWTIFRQRVDAAEFMGLCQLVHIDDRNQRAELLMILKACHQGYGIEVLLLILETFFNRYGLNKLVAYVVDNNRPVVDMCLRLGFKQEGYLQQHLFDPDSGRYSGLVQLALFQADYRQSVKLQQLKQRFEVA